MKIIKTPTELLQVDEAAKVLTQQEYDALPDREKVNGTYYIEDSDDQDIDFGDIATVLGTIGDTDISYIADGTLTGAAESLYNTKANQTELDVVKKDVEAIKDLNVDLSGLAIIGKSDISNIADGTLTGAALYLNANKANKIDIDNLNTKINTNITSISLKANKKDLDAVQLTTDTNKTDISNLSSTKANKSDLSPLLDKIDTNKTNISTLEKTKADQVDLDSIRKKVDTNVSNISALNATKVNQVDLDKVIRDVEFLKNNSTGGSGDGGTISIIGTTLINDIADGTLTGGLREVYDNKINRSEFNDSLKKIDSKSSQLDLDNLAKKVTLNTNNIATINENIAVLDTNKANKLEVDAAIKKVSDKIDNTDSHIIGDTDISTIADGTLTGAVNYLELNKVNISELDKLSLKVATANTDIANLSINKADKVDLDSANKKIDSKANQVDFNELFSIVTSNTETIKLKADQIAMDDANKKINLNTKDVSSLKTIKANQTDLDAAIGNINLKANQSALDEAIDVINKKLDMANIDGIGSADISKISDGTLTGSIVYLEESKAPKADLGKAVINITTNATDIAELKKKIDINIGNITTNTAGISANSAAIILKADKLDLDDAKKKIDKNTLSIGTNTSAIITKANQTDLDLTNSNIKINTNKITDINNRLEGVIKEVTDKLGDSILGKIDITDISDTITGAIRKIYDTKLDKADIDAINAAILNLTGKVETNEASIISDTKRIVTLEESIVTKAEQSELNLTISNVKKNTEDIAANTAAIATKVDKVDVSNINKNMEALTVRVTTNETNIATNTADILLKANQLDLDATNKKVDTNIINIAKKANQIDLDKANKDLSEAIKKLDNTVIDVTNKVDKEVVEALTVRVTTNETNITANTASIALKADQIALDATTKKADINTANIATNTADILLKANQLDLDVTNKKVDTNIINIAKKANQSDLNDANAKITTNETNIADLTLTKADKTDLNETNKSLALLSKSVDTNTTNITANTAAIALKADKEELGVIDTNVANLTKKVSANEANILANKNAIALKADQTALDATTKKVDINTANIATNTANILLKANQIALDATNKKVDTNTANITANTAAIALKADQTALDDTNKKVDTNTANILLKADQTALDDTNKKVDTNTADILLKANQLDLDATNKKVDTNTASILTNTTAIAKKANQTDLGITNSNVVNLTKKVSANETNIATNTADILLKANQLDLDAANKKVDINTTNIATNTADILLKANQLDLEKTNGSITSLTKKVDLNATGIASNATSITKKANQTDLDITNSNVNLNTTNIGKVDAKLDTAIADLNDKIDGSSTNIGKVDITDISDTITGAIRKTFDIKANQLDLDATNASVQANTAAIETKLDKVDIEVINKKIDKNTLDISTNTTAITLKANILDLADTNTNLANLTKKVDINTADILLKANQLDLDTTNEKVTANTASIEANTVAISSKANQLDLEKTNSNISSLTKKVDSNALNISTNTANILLKANQTDLDATNKKVDKNALDIIDSNSKITSINTLIGDIDISDIAESITESIKKINDTKANIGEFDTLKATADKNSNDIATLKTTKAEKIELDKTNANVSAINKKVDLNVGNIAANASAIALKANQTDLDITNTSIADLTKRVDLNKADIALKANQTDLGTTNANVALNKTSITNLNTKLDDTIKNIEGGSSAVNAIIGTVDITTIGDGTLTGAIDLFNTSKANQTDLDAANKKIDGKAPLIHKHVKADITDFPTSMPASDVYAWAKQPTKPKYTATEVGADPTGSANTALTNAKSYADTKITDLIGGAPDNMNTLKELADAIKSNEGILDSVNDALALKADKIALDAANKKIDINTANIATNAAAILTKADQDDLDALTKKVDINTTNIAKKANQTDLDATNVKVTANTANIALKANKIDLDAANKKVDANTAAIATKANQTDLDATNVKVAANKTSITNLNTKLDDAIKNIEGGNGAINAIIGSTDITDIADGTLTGAIHLFNTSKANQIDLDAANKKIDKNTELIGSKAPLIHKHLKADITDFPTSMPASDVYAWAKQPTKPKYTAAEVGADPTGTGSTTLANAKSYTDTKIGELIGGAPEALDTLKELADAIKSNEGILDSVNAAIALKADKTALAETDKKVAANTVAIALKADKTSLDVTNTNLNNLTKKVDINTANITKKANQADLDATNVKVTANTNAIALKANQSDLNDLTKKVDINIANTNNNSAEISAMKNQIITDSLEAGNAIIKGNLRVVSDIYGSLIGNATTASKLEVGRTINGVVFDGTKDIVISDSGKVDQADFDILAKKVESNTTNIAKKANQSDLDTTNANVTANATAISKKANQADLVVTNTNVSNLAKKVDTNTANIALKANQVDLNNTNANVETNAKAIALKANQSELVVTNNNLTNLSKKVESNTTNIALKANQADLVITNNNISALTTKVNKNTTDISNINDKISSIVGTDLSELTKKVDLNTANILLKANKTDLDATNIKVTANTQSIAKKANQTDLDAVTKKVDINTTNVALKASQTDLDTLTKKVDSNTTNITLKASQTDLNAVIKKVDLNTTNLALKANQTDLVITNTNISNINKKVDVNTNDILNLKNNVSDIEIGGRNYYSKDGFNIAPNDNGEYVIKINSAPTNIMSILFFKLKNAILKPNHSYMIIFDIMSSSNCNIVMDISNHPVKSIHGSNDNDTASKRKIVCPQIIKNVITECYAKFSMPSTLTEDYYDASAICLNEKSFDKDTVYPVTVKIKNIRLVRGTVNTDWTMSQEDIQLGINTNKINMDKHISNKDLHLPAKEAVNNARYLRNDNTWQTITPTFIGLGNVNNTADKDKTVKLARGLLYGVTSGSATVMTTSISGVTEYYENLTVVLKMGVTPSGSGCTVNINNLGAKNIKYRNLVNGQYFYNGATYLFIYNGTEFVAIHSYDSNTDTLIKVYKEEAGTYSILGSKTAYDSITSGSTTTHAEISKKFTINPSTGTLSSEIFSGKLSGNADTASKLSTARKINGVAFDGSSDITINAIANGGTSDDSKHLINYLDRPASINFNLLDDSYKNKLTYTISNAKETIGHSPNDSGVITMAWDNGGFGSQLAMTSYTNAHMYIRGAAKNADKSDSVWDTTWKTVLDDSNYKNYTTTKTGGGASGTWDISVKGNAATATKLATARTIVLSGGANGSATFDGSGNITIKNTVNTIDLSQPIGTYTKSNLSYIDSAKVDTASASRTSFLPADGIIIEYSLDAGKTWINSELSNGQKIGLVSGIRTEHACIGKDDSTAQSINNRLRITLIPKDGRMSSADQIYFWLYSYGTWCTVDIEESTGDNPTVFKTFLSDIPIDGWPGNNMINIGDEDVHRRFGGTHSYSYAYRMTFKINKLSKYEESLVYSPYISDLRIYGNKLFSGVQNNRKLFANHMYSWDAAQNVTFPANVQAKTFIGDLAGTATKLNGFISSNTSNPYAIDDAIINGLYYVNGSSDIYGSKDGATYVQAYTKDWIAQIYQDYRTGQIALRGKNNGGWQGWRKVLDDSNYKDYTVTKTGSGASGTWGISISGNSATADRLKVPRTIAFTGAVTGSSTFDGTNNITINTTLSSHNHDGEYLKLSGGSMTGGLIITDHGLLINSNEKDMDVWRVQAASTSKSGFSEKYLGSKSGNLNSLQLVSDNQAGVPIPIRTINQDGAITFHTAIKFDSTIVGTVFNGSLVGNASSADKLKTPRTITLAGAIAGSASFDGSNNITITTTLGSHNHDSVYLKLSGGTMTGGIKLADTGGSLVHGMTENKCITSTQSKTDSYYPILNQTGFNKNVFNIGGVSNGDIDKFGVYVFKAGRTENAYDYATYWTNLGELIHTGSMSINNSLTVTSNITAKTITATTFTGALAGNANTATKLATARTITLAGAISGSVSFDGSNNVTITTTADANSHNHTSLKDVTSIAFKSGTSDIASITSTVTNEATVFDFNLSDDINSDYWRWRFASTSAMELKPVSKTTSNLIVSGELFSGTNKVYHQGFKPTPADIGAAPIKHEHNEYIKIAGGSMTGALNLAKNTLNKIGDNSYLGDQTIPGAVCIKGATGNTALAFLPYGKATKTQTITADGNGNISISDTTKVTKMVVNDKVALVYDTANECLNFNFL